MRSSRLYHQLSDLLGQSGDWADQRHLQTLIWMVIGMICSECISRGEMGHLRAESSPGKPRVISADDRRWLHNSRINVQRVKSPLIAAAKREVGRVRNDVD